MASALVRTAFDVHHYGSFTQPVGAVEEIRRMRGGCQSHLMRCSDGHYYVVKFPNNPQGKRVLANELLCSQVAELLSLPVAGGEVVSVSDELVAYTEDLCIQQPWGRTPCESGLCFGSRWVIETGKKMMHHDLPSIPSQVRNIRDFYGMLVFDLWTANTDNRQVVFAPEGPGYHAVMIDQGSCLGGDAWQFIAPPRSSLYLDTRVYNQIGGMRDFEPWLAKLEEIDRDELREIASGIPPSWFDGDYSALTGLVDQLYERRLAVEKKIRFLACSFPKIFPQWKSATHP